MVGDGIRDVCDSYLFITGYSIDYTNIVKEHDSTQYALQSHVLVVVRMQAVATRDSKRNRNYVRL